MRLNADDRRSVTCPTCYARTGRACVSSRQPGANTLGGGWGGPPELDREHPARVATVRARLAKRGAGVAS
jgi:hypothetical protein